MPSYVFLFLDRAISSRAKRITTRAVLVSGVVLIFTHVSHFSGPQGDNSQLGKRSLRLEFMGADEIIEGSGKTASQGRGNSGGRRETVFLSMQRFSLRKNVCVFHLSTRNPLSIE